MKRYTIRRNGMILGTYAGSDENEALDTCYEDAGYESFAAACAVLGLTRDNHSCTLVKE